MANTIAIHVGGAGMRLGTQLWDHILADHGVSGSGQVAAQSPSDGGTFLDEVSGGRLSSRAIVVDVDLGARDVLSSWANRQLLPPANVFVGSGSGPTSFAQGFMGQAALRDAAVSRVNRMVSGAPQTPTFLVTHSLAGGTGGGLGAAIVAKLRAQHPDAPIVCCSVMRDSRQADVGHRAYDEVLALDRVRRLADLVVVIDNRTLRAAVQHKFGNATSGYSGHNQLAGRALAAMTSAVRLPSDGPMELRELAHTLTPHAGLNLAGLAVDGWGTATTGDIVARVRTGYNRISGIPVSAGKVLSPVFIAPSGRRLSPMSLRADARLGLPAWYPPGATVVRTRSTSTSALLVESNTGIRQRLNTMVADFDRLFKSKAFVSAYSAQGVGESVLHTAQKGIKRLASAYNKFE